jgi:3-oxoacyl-[acyl-carrier protein] reductase
MKRALVTGAGRGIGLATARAFERAGWRVTSLDKEFGSGVVGERIDFDLRRTAEIAGIVASLGDVDTVVNNAAVLYCDPVDAIPEEHRREILAVNLEAPAALIAAVAPRMKERRSGRICQREFGCGVYGTSGSLVRSDESGIAEPHQGLGAGAWSARHSGERGRAGADEDSHV